MLAPSSELITEGEDDPIWSRISDITECPFEKLECRILIDESDMSEWVCYGFGVVSDHNTTQLDKEYQSGLLDASLAAVEKETGLVVTSRIKTYKKGDPLVFSRKILREVTKVEVALGVPAYTYLAPVS